MTQNSDESVPGAALADIEDNLLPEPDGATGLTEPRLSPSAIGVFKECRRRFYYQYVLRSPGRQRPSPMLGQGSAIHEALDLFFGLAPEDRSEDAIHRALRKVWRKHCPAELFEAQDEEIAYGKGALEMLSGFLRTFDGSVRPVRREGWVSAKLKNGVEVFGKVDRVDALADGLDVIDYKAGKVRDSEEDLPGLPATQVYLLGTEAEYDKPVHRVRYIYLKADQELRFDVEREDVDAARSSLIEITNEILDEREFAANPGGACQWCPYSLACPDAHRVHLEDLQPSVDLPF